MAELYYQGHGSLRLTSYKGTVLYLDPFAGDGYDRPADIVLITHEHPDHNQINKLIFKPDTRIIRSSDILHEGQYLTLKVDDFVIEGFPAYNRNHDRRTCVGFLIEVDGVHLYAAGDTSWMEEMHLLSDRHLDYALLPMDGYYNMDAMEAMKCAAVIKARHTIPIHTSRDAILLFDAKVAASFLDKNKLIVVPGETLLLKAK